MKQSSFLSGFLPLPIVKMNLVWMDSSQRNDLSWIGQNPGSRFSLCTEDDDIARISHKNAVFNAVCLFRNRIWTGIQAFVALNEMRHSGQLCDIVIDAGGRRLRAHKVRRLISWEPHLDCSGCLDSVFPTYVHHWYDRGHTENSHNPRYGTGDKKQSSVNICPIYATFTQKMFTIFFCQSRNERKPPKVILKGYHFYISSLWIKPTKRIPAFGFIKSKVAEKKILINVLNQRTVF